MLNKTQTVKPQKTIRWLQVFTFKEEEKEIKAAVIPKVRTMNTGAPEGTAIILEEKRAGDEQEVPMFYLNPIQE